MMATTHAFVGLALAVLSLPLVSGHASPGNLLAAAFVGGLVPDLDLLTNHRKTLHFPVFLPVAAALRGGLFVATGTPVLLVLAFAAGAAGLHSLSDVLAGGVGYEPWTNESGHAVYNHLLGRWHAPRRLVRYSGAPEDAALGAAFAVPAILAPATGPEVDVLLAGVLVATAGYAATRRQFSRLAAPLRSRLPAVLLERLPEIRFEEG